MPGRARGPVGPSTPGPSGPPLPRRIVVIGHNVLGRSVCASLADRGADVVHLGSTGDDALRAVLDDGGVDAIAVLLHDDHVALRYTLMSAHLAPDVPVTASVFDRTVAGTLQELIPWCSLSTPGNLAAPSLAGPCVGGEYVAAHAPATVWTRRGDDLVEETWTLSRWECARLRWSRVSGQLRPHHAGSRMLVAGLLGLLLVLVADWAWLTGHGHGLATSFYDAARVVTTVGPAEPVDHGSAYLILSALAMLTTVALTAAFTAGIVEHLLSPRLVTIVGRRARPTSGHVVVVGLGQVGLRLCQELVGLGIPVIAVERSATAPAVRIARGLHIPVVIGDGEDRRVLEDVRLRSARALAAVGSDDMDNVATAVAAHAVAPGVRVVLRAGQHDAITETRSLLPLGTTRDVTAAAAAWMTAQLLGAQPTGVVADSDRVWVQVRDGGFLPWSAPERTHCRH